MGGRSLLAASLVVLAALVGWIWSQQCGGSSGGEPVGDSVDSPAGGQRSTATRDSRGQNTPPRPSLAPRIVIDGGASPSRFEDEDLDEAWATPQARELAQLVRAVLAGQQLTGLVKAGPVTCRTTHCRFVLSARSAAQLPDAIAVLEDERGLRDMAEQMKLSDLSGTTVTVTLRFRRASEPANPVPDN